jgi:hypothetical protein
MEKNSYWYKAQTIEEKRQLDTLAFLNNKSHQSAWSLSA